jgi:hypothetical protein
MTASFNLPQGMNLRCPSDSRVPFLRKPFLLLWPQCFAGSSAMPFCRIGKQLPSRKNRSSTRWANVFLSPGRNCKSGNGHFRWTRTYLRYTKRRRCRRRTLRGRAAPSGPSRGAGANRSHCRAIRGGDGRRAHYYFSGLKRAAALIILSPGTSLGVFGFKRVAGMTAIHGPVGPLIR